MLDLLKAEHRQLAGNQPGDRVQGAGTEARVVVDDLDDADLATRFQRLGDGGRDLAELLTAEVMIFPVWSQQAGYA